MIDDEHVDLVARVEGRAENGHATTVNDPGLT
jgi:hypothetical protein